MCACVEGKRGEGGGGRDREREQSRGQEAESEVTGHAWKPHGRTWNPARFTDLRIVENKIKMLLSHSL